ncbi:MAG TPA: hypothetical protein VEZ24_09175 [Microvirga sp.]|nr:hypothetical protein [Microvirga sp.]
MPYVQRDENGQIVGAYAVAQPGYAEEWIEEADLSMPVPQSHRSVAMWRARTIMKVTPWGGGTLFDAVQQAIAGLTDPLQKAAAEEALERGDVFDRDGMFVPMFSKALGISDEQLDTLMRQAAELPA